MGNTQFPDTQPLAAMTSTTAAAQRPDGDLVFMVEAMIDEAPLTADHARSLAAALLDAADRLDRITCRLSLQQATP